MVKFIWCCSLVVTVQRLYKRMSKYVCMPVCMCVVGDYDGEPASLKSNCNFQAINLSAYNVNRI